MKIYTFYSQSHARMFYDFFRPSVPEFCIYGANIEQICDTGVYQSKGWVDAMREKVKMLVTACLKNSEPFVYSDVDVICSGFTPQDVRDGLGEMDIACMHNGAGESCSGFMFVKPSPLTASFFEDVLSRITVSDQPTVNEVLKTSSIKSGLLPDAVYTNYGLVSADSKTKGIGCLEDIPETAKVFHANYIIGIKEKEEVLAAAKRILDSRRKQA